MKENNKKILFWSTEDEKEKFPNRYVEISTFSTYNWSIFCLQKDRGTFVRSAVCVQWMATCIPTKKRCKHHLWHRRSLMPYLQPRLLNGLALKTLNPNYWKMIDFSKLKPLCPHEIRLIGKKCQHCILQLIFRLQRILTMTYSGIYQIYLLERQCNSIMPSSANSRL